MEQAEGGRRVHLDKLRVGRRLFVVVTEMSEAHQPGSKLGRVNINAQHGVPVAPPVLTGPQPASSGSPLGRMSPHLQVHQDEHPQDAPVLPPFVMSLLTSLRFAVPWPARVVPGPYLAPFCCAPYLQLLCIA